MNGYFRRSVLENHFLVALGVVLLLVGLYEIRAVLVVVFISYVLMAAISPLVELLVKKGMRRWLAVLLSYLLVISGLVLLVFPLVPFFVRQVSGLFESLPFYLGQTASVLGLDPEGFNASALLRSEVDAIGRNMISLTGKAFSGVFSLVAILVLPLYFLLDKENLQQGVARLAGGDNQERIMRVFNSVDQKLGYWSRGQLIHTKKSKKTRYQYFGTTMATKRDRRSTSTRQSSTYSWSKYAIQWLRIRKQLRPNQRLKRYS